jgi:hypothetical protein
MRQVALLRARSGKFIRHRSTITAAQVHIHQRVLGVVVADSVHQGVGIVAVLAVEFSAVSRCEVNGGREAGDAKSTPWRSPPPPSS